MNKKFKKLLSMFLALVVTVVSLPIGVFGKFELGEIFSIKAQASTYEEGVLSYNITDGEALVVACETTATGDIVIPSTLGGYPVTKIADNAFLCCESITGVSIPYGVTEIGVQAFMQCLKLKTVSIPNSVAKIDYSAFYNCPNLCDLTIPSGVIEIGADAFARCNSLIEVTVPDSVVSLGDSAFYWCENLKKVTLGSGIKNIGKRTFESCESLETVLLGENVESIGEYAFNLSGLKAITIPDSVNNIDKYAFYCCESLKTVILGSGIDRINECVFAGCLDLKEIVIPGNVKTVCSTAFSGCSSLENLTICDGVELIEDYSFYECISLSKVEIPDSVTVLQNFAFRSCTGLSEVIIGSGVSKMHRSVFMDCNSLAKITVREGNAFFSSLDGVLFNKDKTEIILYPTEKNQSSYIVPSSVVRIGDGALRNCTQLSKVTISEGVIEIGDNAFNNCTNLAEITVYDSITHIGMEAFLNTEFYNNPQNWSNGILYLGNNLIAFDDSVSGNCEIKSGTKTIADYAFWDCDSITGVVIPDSVENIGNNAFYYCICLADITMSSNIKNIGEKAFYRTEFYDEFELVNNAIQLDGYLLSVDDSVSGNYFVSESVTFIADKAFSACANLEGVVIPESVKAISKNAFAYMGDSVIYCMPNSYALQYCIDNGLNYTVSSYESLKLDISNAETEYTVGDTLNTDGLKAYVVYSSGIEKEVALSDVTFSMTELKRSGQFRITVSYTDLSSYYTVTVSEPVLESVEVKTMPDKISYISGESIDTTGLVLTVNYGNSTQKEITEGFVVTGSLDEAGETVVTVSYSENGVTVYTEYSVTVTEGDYAVVSADNMSVLPGETVSVPVKISNNSGFMGFAINIAYDESIFTPVSVTSGEMLSDGTLNDSIGGNVESGNLKIVFSSSENITADGVLFTVELRADKLATAQISAFDVSYLESDTFDEEWNDVKLICKDFDVEIKGSESSVPMFYAEDIEGKSGLNITVPVMVGNNSGMTSFDLTLSYDSNILNPLSVSSGEVIEGEIKSNCSEASGKLSLLWNGDVVEQDGTVAYVVFGIDEEAIGNTEITISCSENCDAVGDSFSICISKPGTGSTAEIYSPQVSVLPGQTVDIPLYISNNSGVMGFGLIVSYDSNVLTPVSIEKGDLLSSGTLENNIGNADGSYKIIWNHSADVVGDGLLLTLSFEAAESIEVQNIAISVEFVQADTYNEAWEKVELEINDITLLVDSLIIKSSSSEIYTGETIQLSASYNYSQEACSVVWTTDNAEVADVDENGLMSVYSLGSATITATTADGNYSASYEINVIPRTLTVEWNVDGEVIEQTVIEGEEIVEPAAPERYGYSFSGWTPEVPETMPAYNLVFTAVWIANIYTVEYDANGGVWSDNQTVKTVNVEFDKEIFEPEAPTKEGYVFGGWSYDGENICDSLGLMDSTDGKFLTAVWIPSDATCYTVETYLMNTNGEYDMTYQVFTGVTEATVSVEPEINIGFELNVENSILEGEILADSSLVLKVYIVRKIYSLTTVVDGVSHTTDYLYEESVTEPETPEKTGYTFVCWSSEIPETMPAENVTVTAIWSANVYNAVFQSNGGAWLDTSTKKTVKTEYGAEIVAPESPAREGYSFAGWLLDGENMGTDLGIMDDVNGKIFEAAWIVDEYATYTVETYTMNTSGEYDKSVEVVKAKTGEVVSVEPDVSEGFTLNTAKSVLLGTVSADNSLVLKVYIDRNVYSFITVVDGVSSRTSYFYGSMVSEPATPVKSGYKFIKWNGEIPETMPDENVTVTAVFEKLYVCPDCSNEFLGEDEINAHIAAEARMKATVKIKNNSGSRTINYGETLRLTAITSNMPADAKIYWYVDGVKKSEGTTFEVSLSSGSVEVTVKLVDTYGNAIKNAGGNKISDSEKVSVNAGFFRKIISFFKNLFGMNRTIVQAFKTIY